ncbi:MAG TPA: ATP-dependent helicase [Acidimicrobiales bacterium]|nr:ATP-dependent helicase [Acidimicrobiales bacterium]
MFDTTGLNDQQRAAVDHDERPLLILAGAGTGKTATLAARVAAHIEAGVEPERICLLTFSRRAAAEMLNRAASLADPGRAARVVGGTFHAVAQGLLRHYGPLVGVDPGFSVIDPSDAAELMGLVRQELELAQPGGARVPRGETLLDILSHVSNAQTPLSDVLARTFPWCSDDIEAIRAAFVAYTARKRAQRLCDFDDLLLLIRAFGSAAVGAAALAGLFDRVLVDEYQDVNPLQVDVVDLLRPGGRGVTVVGDDAQAIYGFRSATTEAITAFPERYPGAVVIRLEQNSRSTTPILAIANQLMADAPGGATKNLWSQRPGERPPVLRGCADEAAQAEAVCDSVLAHREDGVDLRRQAVLFRTGHHSDILEVALSRRRIPYVKYGGLRFLDAAHVRDLVALVRVVDNPWDELAWFRVLRMVEGVGPATARRVMDELGVRRGGDAPAGSDDPLARLLAGPPAVPATAATELAGLASALGDCAGPGPGLGAQVDRLRRWLDPVVRRRYDAAPARCGDLERLVAQARSATSRRGFVSDLTLDPPRFSGDRAGRPVLDDDWLVLSTVHSAKGGEWDVVHLIHAVDGMFPSDLATGDEEGIAEERRLFYVAVTRARDVLEVNAPLRLHRHRFRRDDRHGFATLSRFLSPAVRALMEESYAGPAPGEARPAPVAGSAVESVDARLAELWG